MAAVQGVLDRELAGLRAVDSDVFEYVSSMLADVESHGCDAETLQDMVGPFLLSSGAVDDEAAAEAKVNELAQALQTALHMGEASVKHK
jgi:hypothetical protein